MAAPQRPPPEGPSLKAQPRKPLQLVALVVAPPAGTALGPGNTLHRAPLSSEVGSGTSCWPMGSFIRRPKLSLLEPTSQRIEGVPEGREDG